jgi:hypothetical protein
MTDGMDLLVLKILHSSMIFEALMYGENDLHVVQWSKEIFVLSVVYNINSILR